MTKSTLNFDDVCARLDRILQAEFTIIRTEQPVEVIAGLPRMEQDYILNWVERIAITNIQIAYQFITRARFLMYYLYTAVLRARVPCSRKKITIFSGN